MKKTFTANISGIVFHIDEDAYEAINNYLNTLKRHYSATEGGDEIVSDIESRIAEILQGKVNASKQAVTIDDVHEMIAIMGNPEEIFSEDQPEEKPGQKEQSSESYKRIYRDTDNRILGGVLSGTSAYFNIDVTLLRILYIIFCFISFGTGIFVYLVLWVIIPEAKTTSEKLWMKGEKVTISNIEKSVKEEFEQVKSNFKEMKRGDRLAGFGNAIEKLFGGLGHIFFAFARVIMILTGLVLTFVAVILLLAFAQLFLFRGDFMFMHPNWNSDIHIMSLMNLVTDPITSTIFWIGLALVVVIPVVGLIMAGIRLIFNIRTHSRIITGITLGFWIIGLGFLLFSGLRIGHDFKNEGMIEEPVISTSRDTLFVSFNNDSISNETTLMSFENEHFTVLESGNKLFIKPFIDIEASENGKTEITLQRRAHGESTKQARKNASLCQFNYTAKDSLIVLDPFYSISKNRKYRGQFVKITIRIPEGKCVSFGKNADEAMISKDEFFDFSDGMLTGNTFKMGKNEMLLLQ